MKYRAFPFTAIKGQDEMKMALLLNVIDPKIGGVLLTGQQGTGKTTAVRSLAEILPNLSVRKGCPFNCNPNSDENEQCEICKSNKDKTDEIYERITPLVNLPLGITEDMVVGSLDIEKILSQGIKALNPGLLAKANRGILYVDEINLLQDHIIDILLDSSATGINIIEREGVSLAHAANFILVGSMNPEEGELRPQIQDRLGLEVKIRAPQDSMTRARITKDVIEFSDDPEGFLKIYEAKQTELRQKLMNAKKNLKKIMIPESVYIKIADLVRKSGVYSQRADITLIRCARAHAALNGQEKIDIKNFEDVFQLVFGHRMKSTLDQKDPEYYESEVKDILGQIKEAIEDPEKYKPNWELEQNTLKFTEDSQKEFKENPLDNDNIDIPEWNDEGGGTSKNRFTDKQKDFENPPGYKVGKTRKYIPPPQERELPKEYGNEIKKIDNLFHHFRRRRGYGNFSGRGNRAKILSEYKGAYLTYREPAGRIKSIAFDASLKSYMQTKLVSNKDFTSVSLSPPSILPFQPTIFYQPPIEFPIRLSKSDIKTKMYEYKAPLTIYFILDASASMIKSLKQTKEVIKSLHAEGYKKKDKVAVITFFNKDVYVLQEPSISLTKALKRLENMEAQSYTPLAVALDKVLKMIRVESVKSKDNIPVIIICSDMGANISARFPNLEAQTVNDFNIIIDELRGLSRRIGQKKIRTILMTPKKSYATRYLGIHPQSATEIIEDFKKYASAEVFEFELKNAKDTIIQLKRIL